MINIILFLALFIFSLSAFAQDETEYLPQYCDDNQSSYNNKNVEPSKAVYDAEQEMYIEENFGSDKSREFLNSPKIRDTGAGDFDRNY